MLIKTIISLDTKKVISQEIIDDGEDIRKTPEYDELITMLARDFLKQHEKGVKTA